MHASIANQLLAQEVEEKSTGRQLQLPVRFADILKEPGNLLEDLISLVLEKNISILPQTPVPDPLVVENGTSISRLTIYEGIAKEEINYNNQVRGLRHIVTGMIHAQIPKEDNSLMEVAAYVRVVSNYGGTPVRQPNVIIPPSLLTRVNSPRS